MQTNDDFNTPMIAFVGLISSVLIVAIIFGVQVLYHATERSLFERNVIQASTAESDSMLAEQNAKLTRYGWLDKQAGRTAVPIQRAMELVVRDLSSAPADVPPATEPEVDKPGDPPAEPTPPVEDTPREETADAADPTDPSDPPDLSDPSEEAPTEAGKPAAERAEPAATTPADEPAPKAKQPQQKQPKRKEARDTNDSEGRDAKPDPEQKEPSDES
jgi:hypothetical protein